MSTSPLPTLFISHGSPMFALEPGIAGPKLKALGQTLPRPKAIAIISPHWMTRGAAVCTNPQPETIHDFGGFDSRLFFMNYPASGGIEYALIATKLIANAGWNPVTTDRWGLDHGAWLPLRYLYPQADVPVFQISMPEDLTEQRAFEYGQALSGLREQGVLIIGSGSLTHNLSEFRGQAANAPVQTYVSEFVGWVRDAVACGDAERLQRTRSTAPHAVCAHPTDEHYLPLLVAMGAAQGKPGRLIDGGVTHGILSMDSFVFGDN